MEEIRKEAARTTSLLANLLTDTINKVQTSSWKDYVGLNANLQAQEKEEDTGLPPRGLSDDAELERLGVSSEVVSEIRNLMSLGADDGSSY